MYICLNWCKQMTDVKLLVLHSNTCDHLTVCKRMSLGLFKNHQNIYTHTHTHKHIQQPRVKQRRTL